MPPDSLLPVSPAEGGGPLPCGFGDGAFTDADLAQESARLAALQAAQLNDGGRIDQAMQPGSLLSLFRPT
jgi:hypothetical protein